MQKFPKHFKFCPRCGGKLKINLGKKFETCLECGFHVFDDVLAGVTTIIINSKSEVLLTKRGVEPHKGMWGTPGGFVDRGDSAEDAVRREIKEELDLKLGKLVYLGSDFLNYRDQNVDYAYLQLTFLARVGKVRPKARDDITAAKFFAPNKIPYSKMAWPSQKAAIKAYFKENGS